MLSSLIGSLNSAGPLQCRMPKSSTGHASNDLGSPLQAVIVYCESSVVGVM